MTSGARHRRKQTETKKVKKGSFLAWNSDATTQNDELIAQLEQELEDIKSQIEREEKRKAQIESDRAEANRLQQEEQDTNNQVLNPSDSPGGDDCPTPGDECQKELTLQDQLDAVNKRIIDLELKQQNITDQVNKIRVDTKRSLRWYFIIVLLVIFISIHLNNQFIIFPALAESYDLLSNNLHLLGLRVTNTEQWIIELRTKTMELEQGYKKLGGTVGNLVERFHKHEITLDELRPEYKKLETLIAGCRGDINEQKRLFLLDQKWWYDVKGIRLPSLGCFFSNTSIQLDENPNHTLPVWLIQANHTLVWNPMLNKSILVQRTIVGPEEGFRWQISTSNKTVEVSQYHPMILYQVNRTASDLAYEIIPAYQLQIGQWTDTIDGPQQIIAIEKIPILVSERVYNLELSFIEEEKEGKQILPVDRMIVANGVFTSDLWTQEQLVEKKKYL